MYAIRIFSDDGHNETRYYGGTEYRGHLALPMRLYTFAEATLTQARLREAFPALAYKIERHPPRP